MRKGPSPDTPPTPKTGATLAPHERTRVTKTMWPGQPGTQRMRTAHGDALICVRYRQDQAGLRRYTTVELIVDAGPLTHGRLARSWFPIEIDEAEKKVRAQAIKHGARYDAKMRYWYLSGTAIQRLGWEHRVRMVKRRGHR